MTVQNGGGRTIVHLMRHARATAGWKGRAAAILCLVGFTTFLFNFVGVNLFVGGLHSYAR